MKEFINEKVLVTASNWFYAPNGQVYRGVWGTLKAIESAKEVFGFQVNHSHANFYVQVGDVVIAGCQVLYCVKCNEPPPTGMIQHTMYDSERGLKIIDRPNEIYISK